MTARSYGDPDIQAVLADRDVVVLATVAPGGAPLAMPMWFVHDQHRLVMVSAPGLAKVRNLEQDPRVCVVAEGGDRGNLYGLVLTGVASFLADVERRTWGERFHAKYTPHVDRLWGGDRIPDNRVVFGFEPRVASAYGL